MTRELASGFTVGHIRIPGACEHCKRELKDGDRVAMWNPTAELFCIECAKGGVRPKSPLTDELVIPALAAIMFLAAIIVGVVR